MKSTSTLIASTLVVAKTSATEYQTHYYNQTLDHFHPESSEKFSHRFLLNDDYFDGRGSDLTPEGCPGPILLYTGNEGDITDFWGANGFMHEYLAPKYVASERERAGRMKARS